jgi:mannose-6-phosphate isomerase-like protein (cupin superfamily)
MPSLSKDEAGPMMGRPCAREAAVDRRWVVGNLAAFAAYAMVGEARAAAPRDRRLSARRWIDRQEELARGLHDGSVSQIAWRNGVHSLAREVDVAQLMAEVRRSKVSEAGPPFMKDPVKRHVRFLDEDGQPRKLTYGAALFEFSPGNVITPHAHKHMASAHMVVEGKVRVRTFDRLAEEDGALIIRPTGDRVAGVGEAAAMTSVKDNVHWFTPKSERAVTFDVILSDLDAGQPSFKIEPLDPLAGQRLKGGAIRAPILSFEESMRRYSAAM